MGALIEARSRKAFSDGFGELMRGFYLDPAAPISDNDIVDMMHTAMPINLETAVEAEGG